MDKLDKSLLAELRRNGRASISELAHHLQVTRATIRKRMARLESCGEITGYKAVTRGDGIAHAVRGQMMLGIEGRGTERIIMRLQNMPEVQVIHTTNGAWDLIVALGADTLEQLDQVLFAVRKLEGVTRSETSLLLSTYEPGRSKALR
ncbi:Lrp/AsnC family transcriptional regulator [Halovulum sp. GXIMD14793]